MWIWIWGAWVFGEWVGDQLFPPKPELPFPDMIVED